jgi:hypothetical protein
MGLFGSIFKVVGKVAKAGLSVATKGISDKVFSVLKGRGAQKQVQHTPDVTAQQQAVIEKWRGVAPNVKVTSVLAAVKKKQPATVARAMKQRVRYMADEPDQGEPPPPRRKRKPPKALRPRRKPPTGGLDLKALSASWKAAGKPGTWQGWIAANK